MLQLVRKGCSSSTQFLSVHNGHPWPVIPGTQCVPGFKYPRTAVCTPAWSSPLSFFHSTTSAICNHKLTWLIYKLTWLIYIRYLPNSKYFWYKMLTPSLTCASHSLQHFTSNSAILSCTLQGTYTLRKKGLLKRYRPSDRFFF